MSERTWKAIAREAQDHLHASISRVQPSVPKISPSSDTLDYSGLPKSYLSPKELKITETPTEHLVSALAEKSYSAVEVTRAFLRRAVIAQSAVFDNISFMHAKLISVDELHH